MVLINQDYYSLGFYIILIIEEYNKLCYTIYNKMESSI